MAKSTNSRSMRYTCLDVRSPDVNFLRKVMSGSRHDGAAYSRHPCRQSADADIVSAFPLSFYTFQENINTLRQTTEREPFCPFREFCFPKTCSNPVAAAVYKNKLTVSRRRYLARVLSSLMYRYVCARAKAMSAFLIYCHGYGDFRPITSLTFNFLNELNHLISDNWHSEIIFISVPFLFNCQGYGEDFFLLCTLLLKHQGYREDFLLCCTLLFKLQRVQGRLFAPLYPSFQIPRVQGRLFHSLYPSFQIPRAQENIFIFCAHKSIPTKNSQPSAWSIEKYLLH